MSSLFKNKYVAIILTFQIFTYANSLDITNFQAESITTTSFTMTWDTLPDVDYNLAIQLHPDTSSPGSTTPTYTENVTSPYLVLSTSLGDSIQPSTIYDCYLNATNRLNPLDSKQASSVGITTVPGTPDKPILEEPVGAGADPRTQIRVTWYKPSGGTAIDRYIMEWMPSHDSSVAISAPFIYSNINSYLSFEYTLPDLIPGECYNVTVKAQIQATGQEGKPSEIAVYRTVPPTPYNVRIQQYPDMSNILLATWEIFAVGHKYSTFNLASYIISIKNMATLEVSVRQFDYVFNGPNEVNLFGMISPASKFTATMQAISTGDDIAAVTYSDVSNESPSIHVGDSRPTNVTVLGSDQNYINITWEDPVDPISYPIEYYIVDWHNATGYQFFLYPLIMEAQLTGLKANSYYNITVAIYVVTGYEFASSFKSEPIKGITTPGAAVNIILSHAVEDPTTMIRIDWNKPNGGNAIEYYLVMWWLTNNINVTNSITVPHFEGKIAYNYTFDGFIPGEIYTILVDVQNSVGSCKSFNFTQSTVPEPVKDLKLTQKGTNPTRILDLHWISPSGVSDRIEIAYYSLLKENATYKKVSSTVTNISIDVEPGTNYTVIVSVYSYNISSVEVAQRINSKSSEPEYKVKPLTNKLELMWIPPSGQVEGFLIQSDPVGFFPDITVDASVNSYIIQDLTPNTNYTIRMYSWITDIDGNIELSTSTSTTYQTLPAFCSTSVIVYPVNNVNQNATFAETLTGYSNTSLETCPGNTANKGIPLGTRACSISGEWKSPTFLVSCDRDIQELATENITTEEQRMNVTSELVVLTSNPETLEPRDIQDATDLLEVVVEANSLEPNTSALVVETVGNLLAVPEEELVESGTSERLLSTLDDVALKVNLREGEQFQSITSTLAMSVLSLPQKESQNGVGLTVAANLFSNELGFSSAQFNVVYNQDDIKTPSSIYIPAEVLSKSKDGKISFYSFVNDNAFSAKSPLQVSSDLDISSITRSVVNSQIVLAATVVNPTDLIEDLANPIEIRLDLDQKITSSFEAEEISGSKLCAFWDDMNAYWSTKGCITIVSNTSVQCQCDHLTNFASLFAYGDASEDIREDNILDILTYIGSSISLLAIFCTILALICVWNARKLSMQRTTKFAMLNLSLALLLLNVFLLVSELYVVTSNDTSCLAVAIIIHFSLFSSLAWMMVEAIYLFIAITKPIYFRTKLPEKRFFTISSIWGWGFPALFITLIAAIKIEWYIGNDDTCWIDSDMIVYLVIIPAALIIFCNLTCYIVVLVTFLKHKKPGQKSKENQRKRDIMFSLTLFVTFGITWIFGFMLFSSSVINIIFAYIFTIFNALQGVFLFILFVYRNKNMRTTVSQEVFSLSKRFVDNTTQGMNTTHTKESQVN